MSSSDYAIRIKGIGKQYRLGLEQSAGMYKYKSLRDSLGGIVCSPGKTLRSILPEPLSESNSFWALKDVNFDVKKGEVVGIIGRNGAGKSTLLKILSRITRPTTGEIELHGRVGSLLEVGTGFHPELSGRENIYLNGAVLGMTHAEVKKKFDEIVAFSEIEKFLDTPVKQYSSGMYMRLAFAVAAHLEPEILVVDEVLAVGDVQFQQKCLGKMKDVADQGRTVLFVSHNMAAVSTLCTAAVILKSGHIIYSGNVPQAFESYLAGQQSVRSDEAHKLMPTLRDLVLTRFDFEPSDDNMEQFHFRIGFHSSASASLNHCSIILNAPSGARLGIVDLRTLRGPVSLARGDAIELAGSVVVPKLIEGTYGLGLFVGTDRSWVTTDGLRELNVIEQPSSNEVTPYEAVHRGSIRLVPDNIQINVSARESDL